ncbi:sigma-54-dependent transcriptional regulator [Neptuniibacter halophilus]|uniref:sigma-54-dependent transcriptional regulator n=1 Tax=Neptuniibacter halophilus TaxID=651666 RepID=UPI00257376EE|nr:sigma-54 dependent transcriptional regulator [Neptuniibacter halophilus]
MKPENSIDIILIEDEADVREAAQLTLELEGYRVKSFSRAEAALPLLGPECAAIVVSDIRMPGMDGMQLLETVMQQDSELPVILVTGHGDISTAIQAVRSGAYDFIEKPVAPERLLEEVQRALQTRRLVLENRALRAALSRSADIDSLIIGNSPAMQQLKQMVRNIAEADIDILLHGETGTGKELIATTLHQCSNRRQGPFVALNCGAMPESIMESELFGHEAGAFTGAQKKRIGKLEYAHGGTLFLDELESMPNSLQIRLLRVLQERKLERLGGNASIDIDIRVIAASKDDLLALADQGSFREDLYYRLNVAEVQIPPLRARGDDIPLLFQHFLRQAADRLQRTCPVLTPGMIQQVHQHNWPGNVRELQHEAERVVLGISQRFSAPAPLPESEPQNLPEKLAHYEQQLLEEALRESGGRIQEAADRLGIPRKKLYLRMQKYQMDKARYHES